MADELIIPVRLDTTQAKQDLKDLQNATQQQVSASVQARQQQSRREKEEASNFMKARLQFFKEALQEEKARDKEAVDERKRNEKEAWLYIKQLRYEKRQDAIAEAQEVKRLEREKAEEAKKANQSFLAQITSIQNLGQGFLQLRIITQVGDWIQTAMKISGESIKETREQIKGMVSEMEAARRASTELAALRGKPATAGFTAQVAREAAAAGVDVDKYQQFSLAYEAHTGQYTGAEGATPGELQSQGKKISKGQALQLQQQVAGYAVGARGLKPEESAQILSLVISKMPAGSTNQDIMANYAKIMKVAELAPGRTSEQLGQITELGMENVGPGGDLKSIMQAAYLTRVMSQRNPQEASTYGRALMRGLREIRMDPQKMRQLGITRDMDFNQQLQAVDTAVQKNTAAGGDQGEFLSKYFRDIREWGGIQTAINEGIRGGGFKRAEAEAGSVNADTARMETQRYQRGQEGRAARGRSEELAAQRENSDYYVNLRDIQRQARLAVLASREIEVPENMVSAYLTKGGGAIYGQGSREEQLERAQTAKIIEQGLSGYSQGRQFMRERGGQLVGGGVASDYSAGEYAGMFNRGSPEHLQAAAANELTRLREIAEKQSKRQDIFPPLVVEPTEAKGGPR